MKKIVFSVIAFCTALFISCSKESDTAEAPKIVATHPVTISASSGESVKTAYADGKTFSWIAGDQISVQTKNEEGNSLFATFSTSASGPSVDFNGEVQDDYSPEGYAIYPAALSPGFSEKFEGVLTVTLPQSYDIRGLDDPLSILPMIAKNDGSGQYAFQHATAILKFNFVNIPEGATELYVMANQQALSGAYYINLGEIDDQYAAFDKTFPIDYWEDGTGYLNTSLLFDRPETGSGSFYLPVPIGTLNAGLTISLRDANGSTLYSKSTNKDITVDRKKIISLATLNCDVWQSLGTAKFNHVLFSDSYNYSVDVPIQYNRENPDQYRLVNPYGILLPALNIPQNSEPSEYLTFTLLHPGDKVYQTEITRSDLVNFEPVYTGYSANNYYLAHPSYLSGFGNETDYIYNRVIRYASDESSPANIELDGHFLYETADGLYGSYCWSENLVMQIAFPGYDILDYSVQFSDDYTTSGTSRYPKANCNIQLGDDTEYTEIAIAATVDAAKSAIIAGNGTRVERSGDISLSLPNNASTGVYYAVARSYAAGENWIDAELRINYLRPGGTLPTLSSILGTYSASATALTNNSPRSFTFIIEESDDPDYDVMIQGNFGGFPLHIPWYGSFDQYAKTITWSDDPLYYDGDYYGCIENLDSPPNTVIFSLTQDGRLSCSQRIIISAYDSDFVYQGAFRAWSDFSARRTSTSTSTSQAPVAMGQRKSFLPPAGEKNRTGNIRKLDLNNSEIKLNR